MDNAENELEKAFQTITSVVLGKKLTGYTDYESWATENVSTNEYGNSLMSQLIEYRGLSSTRPQAVQSNGLKFFR